MTYAALATRPPHPPCPSDSARIEMLVEDNIRLVRRLAWHVHGRMSATVEVEELIQTGIVALIEAARGFEDRGYAFATYASTRVKGAMIDHLRRASRQTRTAAANRRAIANARRRIENSLCRQASAPEIAAELGVGLPAFYALEQQADAGAEVDIDSAYSDDDMRFCDLAPIGEEAIDGQSMQVRLAGAIAKLGIREQTVLQLYFFEELNLEEIGLALDIGASRVCQIKKAALGKVKALIGEDILDSA